MDLRLRIKLPLHPSLSLTIKSAVWAESNHYSNDELSKKQQTLGPTERLKKTFGESNIKQAVQEQKWLGKKNPYNCPLNFLHHFYTPR